MNTFTNLAAALLLSSCQTMSEQLEDEMEDSLDEAMHMRPENISAYGEGKADAQADRKINIRVRTPRNALYYRRGYRDAKNRKIINERNANGHVWKYYLK